MSTTCAEGAAEHPDGLPDIFQIPTLLSSTDKNASILGLPFCPIGLLMAAVFALFVLQEDKLK